MKLSYFSLILFFLIFSCRDIEGDQQDTLFSKIEPDDSGFDFHNELEDQPGMDIFRYRNYFNGGGVGIGDLNNDGWADIFMVSNLGVNKLYLNQGNFNFKNVTEQAGVGGSKPWSTGVALADVNGDGWLDIYVCNSGDVSGGNRENDLFINNKDGTFSEKAKEYGLNDVGFSTHAAFFDFDQDGDLDCYLLNNSFRPVSSLPIENTREIRDKLGGDKFFINRDGVFVDASDEVGVYGSVIGFGLGITLMDINEDLWTDIYVSNDFFERDYLYINHQGEYFEEKLLDYFNQTSLFSMGADAADLNNDGYEEVFVTDMLPKSYDRLKQTTKFESWDFFKFKVDRGFYHQFMKNTLQMNNGDGTFSELSRQLGVSSTDWSWGAIIQDLDNNGNKDIFVANGVYKDVTDQDFLRYFSDEENIKAAKNANEVSFDEFNKRMPSNPQPNFAFSLNEENNFEDKASIWGLGEPSFSNGAAYGDLDNDGDLDLVVNNLNQPSFLYQNNTNQLTNNHFIQFRLQGKGQNKFAIGAEIKVYHGGLIHSYHHYPIRGFQSSMDYVPTIGVGEAIILDSVVIEWNTELKSIYKKVGVDTCLTVSIADARPSTKVTRSNSAFFQPIEFNYKHQENLFIDFDRNKLLYHSLSADGPGVAVGDINNDGLDDFYIGGASGFQGVIFVNNGSDEFEKIQLPVFQQFEMTEDTDAVFFDADGDGDQDLFVLSGGVDLGNNSNDYLPRLFLNNTQNGKVSFTLSKQFPRLSVSGSCIKPADYDQDGDIDLFIGGRSIPGEYGFTPRSYLLENEAGRFTDVTAKYANQLSNVGMVTDAAWVDYDNDKDLDLILVGDWMPIVLFENRGDFFERKHKVRGLENTEGWWRSIYVYDVDADGNDDLILGNWGINSMFKASVNEPIKLFINDYDNNETLDHVFTYKKEGKYYPYHLRDDLLGQLVYLKKKFPNYSSYSHKSIDQIFEKEELEGSFELEVKQLSSGILMNLGSEGFRFQPLPSSAQVSPIYEILVEDVNGNGEEEILLMGNFSGTKPEEGIYDANHGLVLTKTNSGFKQLSGSDTGLLINGDVRALRLVEGKRLKLLLIGKNNDDFQIFKY